MILPTKGLAVDRALLSVGADLLSRLDQPKTISRLWEQVRKPQSSLLEAISYDWFLLAVDLLYLLRAIDLKDGRLYRTNHQPRR